MVSIAMKTPSGCCPQESQGKARCAYRGPVCLTAEYTDDQAVDRLIAEDVRYARSLFA